MERPRVALVTGSSHGLGRVIAMRLARDGLAVAVNGRDEDALREAAEASRADGGVAEPFPADVTDDVTVADLVAAVRERLGPILVLVVNATGPQPEASVEEVHWRDHLDQLAFFGKSPVLLGRAVLADMRRAGFGLMRSWARELAAEGITVNSVAPGFVPVERHADVSDEFRAAYVMSVPGGRMGTAEEIAAAVSFFVREESGFVTGQRLVVDGG